MVKRESKVEAGNSRVKTPSSASLKPHHTMHCVAVRGVKRTPVQVTRSACRSATRSSLRIPHPIQSRRASSTKPNKPQAQTVSIDTSALFIAHPHSKHTHTLSTRAHNTLHTCTHATRTCPPHERAYTTLARSHLVFCFA